MNLANIRKILIFIAQFLSSIFSLEEIRFCLADQKGGLVLPFGSATLDDKDWIKYNLLRVNSSLKSINPKDLPNDFCDDACRLVDEFRRKTVNEEEEWMLYFDYMEGDVIYCWQGNVGESGGGFERKNFEGRHIASIHSHPIGYYSFPSPDNFDILENDFEDYEIIISINAFWIVEFKGAVEKEVRENFQFDLGNEIEKINDNSLLFFQTSTETNYFRELMVGNYLLEEIDNKIKGFDLILVKKEINNDN